MLFLCAINGFDVLGEIDRLRRGGFFGGVGYLCQFCFVLAPITHTKSIETIRIGHVTY